MKKKNKKKSNIEGKIYRIGCALIVIMVIMVLCSKTSIAQINLEVQELEDKVDNQKDINTSLTMKINEMASLSNIEEVSNDEGLSYNSDNIKTIS